MELVIPALLAGVLTILAPCILPLLPVIVGGAVTGRQHILTPIIMTGSLVVSVVVFTLLVRASTLLIAIPQSTWAYISGWLIIVLGVITLLPNVWETISVRFNLSSNKLLNKSATKAGWWGTVLTGAALGPVFTSCSPTYAFILFTIMPKERADGVFLLLLYAVGLGLMLLAVAYLGQRFMAKIQPLSNPSGWFKRSVGVLFILIGIAVFTGFDKTLEAWMIERGFYDGISEIETKLIEL